MYESQDQLEQLQNLLDVTYVHAGSHLRAIAPEEKRATAKELCRLLKGVCLLDLGTVTPMGEPRVAPVDGLFFQGRFWFGSAHNSNRFQNIRRNPNVSAAYNVDIKLSVVVHGRAVEIDTGLGEYDELHDYLIELYGPEYDDWGYWGRMPFAYIHPTRMYATLFDRTLLEG